MALTLISSVDDEEDEEPKPHERKIWARDWLKRRKERGAFLQLVRELEIEDVVAFANNCLMSTEKFHEIVSRVEPSIKRSDSVMREAIGPLRESSVYLR